jgi:raffinose/stachyose/melibiose transport system permease protein
LNSNQQSKLKKLLSYILILAIATVFTVPLYFIIVSTFKTQSEAVQSPMGLPFNPNIDNYAKSLEVMEYPNALKNNIIITAVSVILIILIASMAGYALSRMRIRINKIIYFIILSGIMIPYQMLIFPLYKMVSFLGLMNKISGIIVILTAVHVPFAIFLFTGFIRTIPYELEEAASIDGCSPFGIYWRITLPLLKPVIATVAIIDSLAVWNEFLTPLLFLQSRRNSVLLLEVFRGIGQFSINYFLMLPMLVLTIAPVIVLYIVLQRYIIKGVVGGAIKG